MQMMRFIKTITAVIILWGMAYEKANAQHNRKYYPRLELE